MNAKTIMAGVVGGIVNFLLGWLIYGVIFPDSMESGMSEGAAAVMREEPIIWCFAIGSLSIGILFAMIYSRFSGNSSFMRGFLSGLWIGILFCLSIDFNIYAQFDMWPMSGIFMDVIIGAVMFGIMGGVIDWMLGRGGKAAA